MTPITSMHCSPQLVKGPACHGPGRRLPLITTIPNVLSSQIRRTRTFFDDNGPGELVETGPRHDNDYADFRNIRILPTVDEILSTNRPVYMPKKDTNQPHFLGEGLPRLLDTHFRHLRYDNTESLRDICYAAVQQAFLAQNFTTDNDQPFHETAAGNRYQLYTEVEIEELIAHEKRGILVRLSFDCPPSLQGSLMHRSTRLQSGMLCALISLDIPTQELSINYFDIYLRQSTISMEPRGTGARRAAVQLVFHPDVSHEDVSRITRLATGLSPMTKLILVEFPKVLHAGFHYPLRRLQQMSVNDIAFHDYLSPRTIPSSVQSHQSTAMNVASPRYCQTPQFSWDLSPITNGVSIARKPDEFIGPRVSATVQLLLGNTTLDEGQALALCNSLGRELVFTQGPPGTGKTFIGVALARVLLASRSQSSRKPIVVVCLTNHALDAFLAGLKDAGVEKLLRVGSGSKEEWTKAINLQGKAKKTRFSKAEFGDLCGVRSQRKHIDGELSSWCQSISRQIKTQRPNWHQIEPVLRTTYPDVHRQLFTGATSNVVQSFTFDYWADGGDLNQIGRLHKELSSRLLDATGARTKDEQDLVERLLQDISVHATGMSNGAGQHNSSQVNYEAAAGDLAYVHTQHQELMLADKNVKQKQDLRVMQEHNIIGITTTGCASRWEVLRALQPEILICEEAGEVMEPHVLCSLFPSLQHAIFIGDPLQLRPSINEPLLSLETSTGSLYRLDESLFERIMMPRDPLASTLPTSQLHIQRRMHPLIADLSRITYPYLKDHDSTRMHPQPKGIGQRMFWLDHRVPEMIEPEVSDSICNPHEVEMVKGFVQYLLRGSGYLYGDIAVLTPYAAQLSKLHEALKSTCSIWLSEKDREMLLDNGQLDVDTEHAPGKTQVEIGDMLRIATVDNFQGEEAKVIILSTVRSGGKPGFLKTQNRINVACSRARDGFYIIGNAYTLSEVGMWRNLINVFDQADGRGPGLELRCDRHPKHSTYAGHPHDFEAFSDCIEGCGILLACGHVCDEKCHDPDLHNRIPCSQPCKNILSCGHPCPKACGEKCGPCTQAAEMIVLTCGHEETRYCSGQITECTRKVEERNLSCGRHTVEVQCGRENDDYHCLERCGIYLICGHECPGNCVKCSSTSEHPPCTQKCGIMLSCNHRCVATCHHGSACPPCTQICEKKCSHGQCKLLCLQPCEPCCHKHIPACAHEKISNTVCSLPSVVAPCSLPCTKVLECGHLCASLHNEVCPPKSACQKCNRQGNPVQNLLYNPACGHSFEINRSDELNLGGIFLASRSDNTLKLNHSASKDKIHLPICPTCGCFLSVHRYQSVAKLMELPDVLDRHLLKLGSTLDAFANTIDFQSTFCKKTFEQVVASIRPNPLAGDINTHIILRRDREVQAVQRRIVEFRDQSCVPFEANLAMLHKAWPKIVPKYTVMFRLRIDVLEYRAVFTSILDKIRISDYLLSIDDFSNELQRQALTILEFVYAKCVAYMAYCQNAIEDPQLATNPCLDAEIRLHQVRFRLLAHRSLQQLGCVGVDISNIRMPVDDTSLQLSLEKVEWISQRYPPTCKSFLGTVSRFGSMLNDLSQNDVVKKLSASAPKLLAYCECMPGIHSIGARKIERRWGQHTLGDVVLCKFNHPYSQKTFTDCCPECGKQEDTEEEQRKIAEKNDAEFLASLRKWNTD